jgi:hypothetical protein
MLRRPPVLPLLACCCCCWAPAAAAATTTTTSMPQQLQVNYQRSPALGVGPTLRFSWAVPPSGTPLMQVHGVQTSYSIVITDAASDEVAWKSGLVESASSINVELDAKHAGLLPGHAYMWTVACDGGPASAPTSFVTALWDGFDPSAYWIWAADVKGSQHYADLRSSTVVSKAAGGRQIKTALLFVTAWQEPTMLASYKFYIDGALVSLGPGRGEAKIMDGNSTFLRAPYASVDVTRQLKPDSILAVEAMAPLFAAPCDLHACKDPNVNGGGVLAQLMITYVDGSGGSVVTTGGSEWEALSRDAYRNPTSPATRVNFLSGQTAYAKVLENIDASKEVVDWKTSTDISWPPAKRSFYQHQEQLVAKMARPQVVSAVRAPTVEQNTSRPTSFFVDFGREFQGGVILTVHDGSVGSTLRFVSGELLLPNGATDPTTESRLDPKHTWGYSFNWTLRDGFQVIEQHNYMIFRYLAIEVIQGPIPKRFSVSAWRVNAEYQGEDSFFASSDDMLNQVHEQARWTLEAGVVDTLTDSNARERRPCALCFALCILCVLTVRPSCNNSNYYYTIPP